MASILVAQDCRSGSSPYRGRYDQNDPVIQPNDEVLRRHYLPVWRLNSGTESKVAFSIPPNGWFSGDSIDSKINQLCFVGVSQLGVVDPMFTTKKETKPGNWAITGITQIGPQMFVEPFAMGSPIYAVPFVTEGLAARMIPTKQRGFNGPVYVDETHFARWAISLLDGRALADCPVPWHPELLEAARNGNPPRDLTLLKRVFPGERPGRLETIAGDPELFRQFVLSTEQLNHWKANFRVGNLLSGGASRSALEVTLRIGQ